MSLTQQILLVLVLSAWVAAWWLAVRILFGRRFGLLEWYPIAIAAFGVPILLADDLVTSGSTLPQGWVIAAWGAVALVIDLGWAVCKVRRRLASSRGEPQASPE
jgi:hypothetical protein